MDMLNSYWVLPEFCPGLPMGTMGDLDQAFGAS